MFTPHFNYSLLLFTARRCNYVKVRPGILWKIGIFAEELYDDLFRKKKKTLLRGNLNEYLLDGTIMHCTTNSTCISTNFNIIVFTFLINIKIFL